MERFRREPVFLDNFTDKFLPPGAIRVQEASGAAVTFLLDGHYFLKPNSAGSAVYYQAVLVQKNGQWQIDKFVDVAEKIWKDTMPK
ncbi:MAG: hypothetical protein IPL73_27830 [Candidatus Obscuribacter sp.]|nr:hypothetical protein [Candidatus Obscuribacter sp.]